jgi:hypothetical protein
LCGQERCSAAIVASLITERDKRQRREERGIDAMITCLKHGKFLSETCPYCKGSEDHWTTTDVDSVRLTELLECALTKEGFGLAYYRGAMDSALRECETFERGLGLDGQSNTWIHHRLQQMNELLKKLEAL